MLTFLVILHYGQELPVLGSSSLQDAQAPDSADSSLTYNQVEASIHTLPHNGCYLQTIMGAMLLGGK